MSEAIKKLKPGWKVWRFDQMATNVNDRIDNPSESGLEHYVGLEHLDPGTLKISRWGSPDDVEATKLIFKKGDIIFGRRRAYQRKLGIAEFDGICSAHAMVLRAKSGVVVPEFFPFFLQSDAFMNKAIEISVGSLSPTINWKTLAAQEFALPTIDEQKRLSAIASAQEELFQELQTSLEYCHRLKQSMRNQLFSGGMEFSSQANQRLGFPVPNGWRIMSLPSIVAGRYGLVDGPFGSNLKSEHYRTSGIPVIQSAFVAKGWFDKSAAPVVFVDQKKYDSEIRSSVSPGDIVMVKIGVNCGACARLPLDHATGILAGNCLKIAVDQDTCDAQFLLHYFHWLRERTVFERMIHSTQQRALSLASLKTLSVGVPGMSEQKAIAATLDDCDKALATIEERLSTARRVFRNIAGRLELGNVQ